MSQIEAGSVRVAMLSYGLTQEAGGPGVAAVGFARGLARLGFPVRLLALEARGRTWLMDGRAAVRDGIDFEVVPASWGRIGEVLAMRRRTIAREPGPTRTVIWVNGIWGSQSIAGYLARRKISGGLIVRPAGSLGHAALRYRRWRKVAYYRAVERHVLEAADAIHCMSEQERAELPSSLAARAFVVPAGVDLPRAPPEPSGAQRPIVGVLARIHPIKRHLEALAAAEALVEKGLDLEIELAGGVSDAEYESILRDRVQASSHLRGRVRFLGHVDHERIPDVVGRWSVALLLSEQENFGHAVITAAALGVPTVVSPGVGLAAALQGSSAGLVVEPPGAASALARILGDPLPYRAAALRMASSFGWESCARALAERILDVARARL